MIRAQAAKSDAIFESWFYQFLTDLGAKCLVFPSFSCLSFESETKTMFILEL